MSTTLGLVHLACGVGSVPKRIGGVSFYRRMCRRAWRALFLASLDPVGVFSSKGILVPSMLHVGSRHPTSAPAPAGTGLRGPGEIRQAHSHQGLAPSRRGRRERGAGCCYPESSPVLIHGSPPYRIATVTRSTTCSPGELPAVRRTPSTGRPLEVVRGARRWRRIWCRRARAAASCCVRSSLSEGASSPMCPQEGRATFRPHRQIVEQGEARLAALLDVGEVEPEGEDARAARELLLGQKVVVHPVELALAVPPPAASARHCLAATQADP